MALRLMTIASRRPSAVPAPAPATDAARLPTLVAPRLQLRWIESADLEDLYGVFSDPEVMRRSSRAAEGFASVFADRLTMPRYGDPRKRRLQARVLLGDTLRILADETPTAPTADDPLDTFCEIALTFWDIVHAPAHIDFGWNRIEASTPESMGGYFALGETPHPPTPEDIHAAAQRLLFQLSQSPPPAQPAALAPWLGSLHTAMSAALTQFAQTAAWPAWVNHAAQLESLSLFARLKSRLKRKVL